MESDSGQLESAVYGAGAVPDAMFLDSVARGLTAVTQALLVVAQEVDRLRAAIEPRDDPADPG